MIPPHQKETPQLYNIGAGNTLVFKGITGNHVDLGDVYNTLTFPFTVQAWVNPASLPVSYTGGIFASDNDNSAYYGFTIAQVPSGSLSISFGDGGGFGYQYRRGLITDNAMPLNAWTQITVVANSVTDVSIYFNGVLQTLTPDDGGSTNTTLTHSSGPANIGEQWNGGVYDPFNGQIDEIRLWNIALSQTDVQTNMCKKINPSTTGLLGYWRADEPDTSATVYDYTSNAINGTFDGVVNRQVSGAALGNTSSYLYTSAWTGQSLKWGAYTGDSLTVDQVSNSPYGVQIYTVNSAPINSMGLDVSPSSYFGVFIANSGVAANYSTTYTYSLADGTINGANEDSATTGGRQNAASANWISLNGTLDTSTHTIISSTQNYQQEYALSFAPPPTPVTIQVADSIGAGNSLLFNGVPGGHVDLGNSYSSLNFPFTVQAWVNPVSLPLYYTGGIFASNNDTDAYYGVTIAQRPSGGLGVSFGNGEGYGYQYRRGYVTNNSLTLNQWSQITVVCNSATDVSIYINGVLQAISPDDGGSTSTALTYSSNGRANIGEQWNGGVFDPFNGQIDEVRLYNNSLSQSYIQSTLCTKISPNTPGLIGYWRADESDTSSTVFDYSSSGINGTINGTVHHVVSGAAIGNTSNYLYTSSWSGQSVKWVSSTGDSLTADQVTGSPYGVQVYAVNEAPVNNTGLISTPNSYFGVFIAGADSASTYRSTYHYSFSDGSVTSANQDSASTDGRQNAAAASWAGIAGTLDTAHHNVINVSQGSPQEYALTFPNAAPVANFTASQTTVCAGATITFTNTSTGAISTNMWTFGGGSSPDTSYVQSPTATFATAGNYRVLLNVSNGYGSDTISVAITVNAGVTLSVNTPAPICSGDSTTLTASGAVSYTWAPAIGLIDSTGSSVTADPTVNTTYTVTGTGAGGCTTTDTVVVAVGTCHLVWPGDANDDLVVDNFDMIPIGLYYNELGHPRFYVSNYWAGQPSTNWDSLQANGADRKYVDCNGDGVINSDDTFAVAINYGLTHLYQEPFMKRQNTQGTVPLQVKIDSTNYHAGSLVHAEVWLGNSATQATNVYALAYDLQFNSSLVEPGTMSFVANSTFLGTKNTDALVFTHIGDNDVETAVVRTDHQNMSGYGKIGDLYFTLAQSIADSQLAISIGNYQATDNGGVDKGLQPVSDTSHVKTTGIAQITANNGLLSIYPNPTNGALNVVSAGVIDEIKVTNVLGQLIYDVQPKQTQYKFEIKNEGIYFVTITSQGKATTGKVIVSKQ